MYINYLYQSIIYSYRKLRNIVKRKTKKIKIFGKTGEEKLAKLEEAHKKREKRIAEQKRLNKIKEITIIKKRYRIGIPEGKRNLFSWTAFEKRYQFLLA